MILSFFFFFLVGREKNRFFFYFHCFKLSKGNKLDKFIELRCSKTTKFSLTLIFHEIYDWTISLWIHRFEFLILNFVIFPYKKKKRKRKKNMKLVVRFDYLYNCYLKCSLLKSSVKWTASTVSKRKESRKGRRKKKKEKKPSWIHFRSIAQKNEQIRVKTRCVFRDKIQKYV